MSGCAILYRSTLAAALLLAAAGGAQAQSFVSMGRLFTTPSERTQLDQARSSGAALSGSPGAPGGAGATSTGAAIAPMTGNAASGPCSPVGGASGPAGGTSLAGCPAGTDAGGAAAGPEAVRLSGVIRRSNGRATVFVNNEPQDGRIVNQGKAARVNIDGRSVVLKPGQSYDPATGAINEPER